MLKIIKLILILLFPAVLSGKTIIFEWSPSTPEKKFEKLYIHYRNGVKQFNFEKNREITTDKDYIHISYSYTLKSSDKKLQFQPKRYNISSLKSGSTIQLGGKLKAFAYIHPIRGTSKRTKKGIKEKKKSTYIHFVVLAEIQDQAGEHLVDWSQSPALKPYRLEVMKPNNEKLRGVPFYKHDVKDKNKNFHSFLIKESGPGKSSKFNLRDLVTPTTYLRKLEFNELKQNIKGLRKLSIVISSPLWETTPPLNGQKNSNNKKITINPYLFHLFENEYYMVYLPMCYKSKAEIYLEHAKYIFEKWNEFIVEDAKLHPERKFLNPLKKKSKKNKITIRWNDKSKGAVAAMRGKGVRLPLKFFGAPESSLDFWYAWGFFHETGHNFGYGHDDLMKNRIKDIFHSLGMKDREFVFVDY